MTINHSDIHYSKEDIKTILLFLKTKGKDNIIKRECVGRHLIEIKKGTWIFTYKGSKLINSLIAIYNNIYGKHVNFLKDDKVYTTLNIDEFVDEASGYIVIEKNEKNGQQRSTAVNSPSDYVKPLTFELTEVNRVNSKNTSVNRVNSKNKALTESQQHTKEVNTSQHKNIKNKEVNLSNNNACHLDSKYLIALLDDIQKLANEVRKECRINSKLSLKVGKHLLTLLLTQKYIDIRELQKNKKQLVGSISTYKADISVLKQIDWIYQDLEGLYKLNTEKFTTDIERAGLLSEVDYQKQMDNVSNNVKCNMIDEFEEFKKGKYIHDGVFSFDFGKDDLYTKYIGSYLLNYTKEYINNFQEKYFEECRSNLKSSQYLDTMVYPILQYNFQNLPFSAKEQIQYPNLNKINKLIVVEGEIIEVTPLQNIVVCAEYESQEAGTKMVYYYRHDKNIKKTIKEEFNGEIIYYVLSKTYRTTYQEILLQQPVDKLNPSEIPKPLKAIWYGAEGIFTEGSKIRVVGILEPDKSDKPISPFCIQVLQLEEIESFSKPDLSEEDIRDAKAFYEKHNKDLDVIANILLPNIKGARYSNLKKAVLLQQVGLQDKPTGTINQNLHILIVSDPGLGKTQILRRIEGLFPNNTYVDMQNSTQPGLIGAMEKRKGLLGESWIFVRGALPLANGGVCCMDEKPSKDGIKYINEAMENGRITVRKAGRYIKAPANFAALMAMNPKYEVFDRDKYLWEQITVPKSTLSRFDLIYTFFDGVVEDEEEIIMGMLDDTTGQECDDSKLIKYILYAQSFNPTLPSTIKKKIAKYVIELRKNNESINKRIANSLKKLVKCSARANLRDEVTEEDFYLAVNLFEDYIKTFAYDPESKIFDFGKIYGTTKKDINKIDIVKDVIRDLSHTSCDGLAHGADIMDECVDYGIPKEHIEELLSRMIKMGDIEEPKPGKYRIL